MSIIIFIIALAVLILVHEFGHFIVAKKSGIKVDEFGLGLPPRLWGKKIGETIYSFNWIPFGGFVKIFGEDPHNEEISEQNKPYSMYYKPKHIQALVLVAGVTFNFIFAWLLISLGFSIGLPAPVGYMASGQVKNAYTTVIDVLPGSPADVVGLRSGDKIISASAGKEILTENQISPEIMSSFIQHSQTNSITLGIERGTEPVKNLTITPETSTGVRMIGVSMDKVGIIQLPFYQALWEGAQTTLSLTKATVVGLAGFIWSVITFHSSLSQVTGPVGIAGSFGQAQELGFVYLLSLVAVISINLAVINLAPFPALDGGRLFFILIEAITRRKIPPKVFQWANSIGFALLILLMIIITGHDIFKLL